MASFIKYMAFQTNDLAGLHIVYSIDLFQETVARFAYQRIQLHAIPRNACSFLKPVNTYMTFTLLRIIMNIVDILIAIEYQYMVKRVAYGNVNVIHISSSGCQS
jgi:hypothetical protein